MSNIRYYPGDRVRFTGFREPTWDCWPVGEGLVVKEGEGGYAVREATSTKVWFCSYAELRLVSRRDEATRRVMNYAAYANYIIENLHHVREGIEPAPYDEWLKAEGRDREDEPAPSADSKE
jgi:hypothetical protein